MTFPEFELTAWFAQAEGRFDYSLSNSDCQPLTVGEFLNGDEVCALRDLDLSYGDFAGLAELQGCIAEQYQNIDAHEVLTFNGPSEAIYTFMRAVLAPGDQIVVPAPAYDALHAIARKIGCHVKEWRARDEFSCAFDVSDLAKRCEQSTKMILINFPHNPSGQTVSPQEMEQIVDIAKSVDAILFSDEVFRLLELPPSKTPPAACDLYDNAVSLSGLSKSFGLGGLRIGWTATKNAGIHAAMQAYRYYTAEMTNTPSQWLACRALQQSDSLLRRNRQRIAANLHKLRAFVNRYADTFELLEPLAGPMAIVKQKTMRSSRALCLRLLADHRLFVVPGEVLGMSDQLLRFGLGRDDFESALKRLEHFLTD